MKKLSFFVLTGCCFFMTCSKNASPPPQSIQMPLSIVISNITSTLTIYSFSITSRSSDTSKLIDIYSQVENKTYTVNVSRGDVLKVNYFLELEGPRPPTNPVITFIYDGVTLFSVTNDAGIVSGSKIIVVP